MLTRVFRFSALALLLATVAGCGLFWDDPYVTVTVTYGSSQKSPHPASIASRSARAENLKARVSMFHSPCFAWPPQSAPRRTA